MHFFRSANYFKVKEREAFLAFLQRNACAPLNGDEGRLGEGREGARVR